MGKEKRLSDFEKGMIDALSSEKYSISKISQKINRSRKVVASYINKKGSYNSLKSSGRPKSLSAKMRKRIVKFSANRAITARQISAKFDLKVSPRTVIRVLHDSRILKRRRFKKKPLLQDVHKEQRLNFAKQYISLSDNWGKVIFSDEKRFNLDGPDGFNYYWHSIGTESPVLSRRANCGGSIMIWACFCASGKSSICFIDRNVDSQCYQNILRTHLLPFIKSLNSEEVVFQQDNAKPHVSKSTKSWLKSENIRTMNWPANSPDLNPIENLWGILVQRVYENGAQFATKEDLKDKIIKVWENIEPYILINLALSMPDRIFNVALNRGDTTKY